MPMSRPTINRPGAEWPDAAQPDPDRYGPANPADDAKQRELDKIRTEDRIRWQRA
jgi:hypothetical protein